MRICDRPKNQLEKLVKCNSTAIDTRYQGSNLCMILEALGHFLLPEGHRPATNTLGPMSGWEQGLLPGLQLQNRTLELHNKLWQTGWVTCEQHRHGIHRLPESNVKDGEMQWHSTISGNENRSVSTCSCLLRTLIGSLNQSATRIFRMTGDSCLLWTATGCSRNEAQTLALSWGKSENEVELQEFPCLAVRS